MIGFEWNAGGGNSRASKKFHYTCCGEKMQRQNIVCEDDAKIQPGKNGAEVGNEMD